MILLNSTIDTREDTSITTHDQQLMSPDEIDGFNNLAQELDEIEEKLEGILGCGADWEVQQALIQILMIKRRLHLSVITF